MESRLRNQTAKSQKNAENTVVGDIGLTQFFTTTEAAYKDDFLVSNIRLLFDLKFKM